jgi:hypothetical protein
MEDSESAEKQENTGIGPASACRGEARSRASFTRYVHAQRVPLHPNDSRRSATSFWVSEAKVQTPGAEMRRGNDGGCLFVRKE